VMLCCVFDVRITEILFFFVLLVDFLSTLKII